MKLFALLITLAHFAKAIVVPRYNGTYGVDMRIKELVDLARFDNQTGQSRRIMTSIFFPTGKVSACKPYQIPYMTSDTAAYEQAAFISAGFSLPNDTFASLQLELCSSTSICRHRHIRHKKWPVALFSPGLGSQRVEYNAIAASLASVGYIVVTMDHPGQTTFIEYADGTTVLTVSNITSFDQVAALLAPRVDDMLLVLSNLRNQTLLPSHLQYNPSQVFVFGHSFGGAASAQVMYQDNGIKAGINMDGRLFGEVVSHGITDGRPFMIFEHEGNNFTKFSDWAEFKSHMPTNRYLEIRLLNSLHRTFTDFPLLADLVGLTTSDPEVSEFLGKVPGARVLEILTAYVDAWFKFRKQPQYPSRLLRGPVGEFPEVAFTSDPLT